jgi:hypothetical protein
MKRFAAASAVAAVMPLMFAGSVNGGIVVTTSVSRPSTDVLVSHDAHTISYVYPWDWQGSGFLAHTDLGQSFLISKSNDVILDKVTLFARDIGSANVDGADYTLEIWRFSSSTDFTGDELVNSQWDTLPSSGLIDRRFWTFDIEDVRLTNGSYYGFLLAFDDGPILGRYVAFAGDPRGGFSDGRLILRSGTPHVWSSEYGGHELDFALQGRVIPEPSTAAIWSLLGAAGIAVAFRARRRAG